MKVSSTKSEGVVSYKVQEDMSWFTLVMKLGLLCAAAAAFHRQMAWWTSAALLLFACMLRCRVSEGILAISGLGLQLERKGRIMFLSDDSRFYAKHTILAALITEVFEGFQINYVLQIVVRHANEMSLVFPQLRPGLPVIKEVWQNIRSLD